ncbi:MAG: SDR family NAD(P)-dependent oxidoreductase [Desulfovibrio sp.]
MPVERVFTQTEQLEFAALSGDTNPMHVDFVHARRLLLGKPVVHGVHLLLWALEQAFEQCPALEIRRIDVRFFKPVPVGETVRFHWSRRNNVFELEARLGTTVVLSAHGLLGRIAASTSVVVAEPPPERACEEHDAEGLGRNPEGVDRLYLNLESSRRLFPHLSAKLPAVQIAALLWSSRIIGMRCPGLHSIFTGMKLSRPEPSTPNSEPSYRLTGFDDRFSFATISMTSAGLEGVLSAFLRPKPAQQPSYATIQAMVTSGEFTQIRGLVIGGSRGLGEVTAKLLAAGGADVKTTYLTGKNDAKALCSEIIAGGGTCSCHPLDVMDIQKDFRQILVNGWYPTDIFYYATPHIFEGRKKQFSTALFDTFIRIYLYAFASLLHAFDPDKPLRVLYPSTVAAEELPADMTEYACAKIAGETLCASYSAQFPLWKITVPRFPRLHTDQTASLYPVENKDPVPILLDVLRKMISTGATAAH